MISNATLAFSQNYVPFPDSNAIWCGQRGQLHFNSPDTDEWHTYTYQQYLLGDTLINGIVYSKLYENGIHEWIAYPIPYYSGTSWYYNEYAGGIREINKLIYYMPPNSISEALLYDFNINVNDTLPSSWGNPSNSLIVTRMDSILIQGNYRKQFFISTADSTFWQFPGYFEYVSIIEGIGSTRGLKWQLRPAFEFDGALYAFSHNGNVLYNNGTTTTCVITGIETLVNEKQNIKIYPNPVFDEISIENRSFNTPLLIKLIDYSGKLVKEELSTESLISIDVSSYKPGLYIIQVNDGKNQLYTTKVVIQ